jgi:hypothetical protein
MNISQDSYITPDEILANVLNEVGDEDYRTFTRGWYMSQIQRCLEELSFDSCMLQLDDDFEFPADTFRLYLPANTFNVKEIFVYNGTLGSPSNLEPVRWKRNYKTKGPDKRYFGNNTAASNYQDLYITPITSDTESLLLFANVYNGMVEFSQSCSSYSFVKLYYNGTLTPIGETPFVPQFFRQAVELWVALQYYRAMRRRDQKYNSLFNSVYAELNKPFTGVWDKAVVRAKSLDSKLGEDLKEYLSKMNANE